jgi:hypothetical protein
MQLTIFSILTQRLAASNDPIQICIDCFAGADTDMNRNATTQSVQGLLWLFDGFCNSDDPNLHLFLSGISRFMGDAEGFAGIPPTMEAVATFATQSTDLAVVNESTGTLMRIIKSTGGGESLTMKTSRQSVPMEYLGQVPTGWPYTRFGVGRRRETVMWELTDGDGETVAVVKHEALWYPRPLWTGARAVLESWRPRFVGLGEGLAMTTLHYAGDVKPTRTMSSVWPPIETQASQPYEERSFMAAHGFKIDVQTAVSTSVTSTDRVWEVAVERGSGRRTGIADADAISLVWSHIMAQEESMRL